MPPVARFTVTLPPNETVFLGMGPSVALSPDGKHLVYVGERGGRRQLYLRPIDQFEAKPIPGTEGANVPFFSPDGQWVGFRHLASRTVKKAALSGGAPITICPTETFHGASWGHDGSILFSPYYPGGLSEVPAAGGKPEAVTTLDSKKEERTHMFPDLLPDGKAVLFTVGVAGIDSYDDARIAVQSLQTGERKILIEGGTNARYSSSGHLVYARAGALLAVPFDLERLAVTGPPTPVVEGVLMSLNAGAAHFSLSANGSLAYVPGVVEGGERLPIWVGRQGVAQPLALPPRSYLHPRISPDGRQLAIEIEGPNHDLYVYEMARGMLTKLTLDGVSHWPLWTPEGSRLTFRSWRTGTFTMWWMPADRSAPEERLTTLGSMQSPSSWSPDGRVIAFTQVNLDTGPDVYVLPMDSERKPRPFVQTKFAEGSPKFSPDGRWIAYCSNESGKNEVYVQPYPGPGPKIHISIDGGTDPAWKRNGGELFYREGDKMMVVAVATYPTFTASRPRTLWTGHYSHGMSSSCGAAGPTSSNYDVTADGQRFIMIQDKDQDLASTQVNVVLNWSEELKHLKQAQRN